MDPIVVNVQLTEDDYLAANRLHGKRSSWLGRQFRWMVATAVVLGGLLLWRGFDDNEWVTPAAIFIWVLVGLAFANWYWLPHRSRKIFRQQKSLHRPYRMSFGDDGIRSESEMGNGRHPWPDVLKWSEGRDLFMVYYSEIVFQMVPKRFLTDPAPLRQLLTSRVGPPV